MGSLKIEMLKKTDLAVFKKVVAENGHKDYEYCDSFKAESAKNYSVKSIDKISSDGGSFLFAKDSKGLCGVASLVDLNWDSKYFGLAMAEIRHFIAKYDSINKFDVYRFLLSAIIQQCKNKDIKHVSIKVDSGDLVAVHALEKKGFLLNGAHLTYVFDFRKIHMPVFKDFCHIRPYKKSDLPVLLEIAKKYPPISKYSNDPGLPRDKVDKLYVEWVKNACNSLIADCVLVAERNNKVVGFISFKINDELKRFTGLCGMHRGLLMVSPEGKGSALSLLKEVAKKARDDFKADFAEWDVYDYNTSLIRIYQKVGLSFIRSRFSFSKRV